MKRFFGLITVFFIFLFNVQAQEWSYQEDFVTILDTSGLHGPHGVVVTPDDRIWIQWYGFTDSLITTSGDTIQTCPIYIYNPDGSLHHQINFFTYNSITDTLTKFGRGISLDNNGNVLYTAWDELWRINYQTYEAMNHVIPVVDATLTEAACDENGYIYITHVFRGNPFYIFDQNFVLHSYVENSVNTLQRSIVTSPDGRDVYLGKIYGGPNNDENGIVHYHSDSGPGGVYTKVDSFHTDIWGQCLDWDRSGLLWIGSYWDIAPDDSSGWYALDPSQNFNIVNKSGQNVGLDPTIGPQPPIGGTYYAPRGAAWSLDGSFMYTADFNGHVIKKWYNPNPIVSNIELSIGVQNAFPGDTILVALDVSFNTYSSYSSTEIDIGGFQNKLEFLRIVTGSSMIGNAGWNTQVNNTDSLLMIASAGSDNINGSGVLLWLEFAVPDTIHSGFVPITLESAIFNTGSTPTLLTSGGVNIEIFTINYGDVDLNGLVQAYDASLILKYLVGLVNLNSQQLLNANVSCDSSVSSLDATRVLQYIVSLIDSLPYCNDSTAVASGNIAMNNYSVMTGQIIDVSMQLSNGSNILGFQGTVTYDPAELSFQSITWSNLLDSFMIVENVDSTNGTINFSGAHSSPDGENGDFAYFTFKVKDAFQDSTIMDLQNLRWNEGIMMYNVAQSVLYLTTGFETELSQFPEKFSLEQNHPNPFNPTTHIRFGLPKASRVKIEVYNMLGQKVAELLNEHKPAGYHNVQFDGSNFSSGVYFYKIKAGEFMQVKKMLLVR